MNENGKVSRFVMNDKCAAGTGRFMEDMARVLHVSVSELGPLARQSKASVSVTSICSVFAQQEVTTLLAEGRAVEDIARSVCESIANRLVSLMKRVPVVPHILVSGGVSKNRAVVKMIEEKMGILVSDISVDPQLTAALGAAVFARKYVG
jgi:predicted CoA-substrate-specific enzyme activase